MENNTKKQGEIKTWNEGKPNVVGSAGALGLIGGIAGRAIKLFGNTAKQYLRKNTTMLNMSSAVKQSLRKSSKPSSSVWADKHAKWLRKPTRYESPKPNPQKKIDAYKSIGINYPKYGKPKGW